MRERPPELLGMGTATMEKDREIEEEGKNRRVNIWKEAQ